jgi:hypothetical protein
MQERKIDIKNFIGVYDGFIPDIECDKAIDFFEKQNLLNKSYDRLQSENASYNLKNDKAVDLRHENVDIWFEQFKPLLINFDIALKNYQDQTGILSAYGLDKFKYTNLKIQKTLPTQGYHVWHVEHAKGDESQKRTLVFTIYLNDVSEGGETEFLHQSVRVKPLKGRCVIWPAAFPYVHRGNPPLDGFKYIITSWLTF